MTATLLESGPSRRSGHPTDFEEMIAAELPGLRVRCRVLTRNTADADDLVQEVMLRAYRAYDRFDGRYPKAWLYTIAKNTHLSTVQANRNVEPCDPSTLVDRERIDDDRETALEGLVRADTAEELLDAINALEPAFREVAQLVLIERRPVRSVAAVLGVPYGTVLSRLYRARQRLRVILHARQLIEDART